MGFSLTGWDYLTFAVILLLIAGVLASVCWIAGLPGRIAIARNHPDAEAVKLMGWAGLLAGVPWIQAFMWAYKPSDIVDIRRYPPEEREEIEKSLTRLRANGGKKKRKHKKRGHEQPEADTNGGSPAGNGHDKPALS